MFPSSHSAYKHTSPEYTVNMRAMEKYLREEGLKFKTKTNDKVQETLSKIGAKLRKAKDLPNETEVIFVGIHNRRSDMFKFMKERFDEDPLEERYFIKAMEFFRCAQMLKK